MMNHNQITTMNQVNDNEINSNSSDGHSNKKCSNDNMTKDQVKIVINVNSNKETEELNQIKSDPKYDYEDEDDLIGQLNDQVNGQVKNQADINSNPCQQRKGLFHRIIGYPFLKIKWFNVIWLTVLHILAIIGYAYPILFGIKVWTVIWTIVITVGTGFGTVAGTHRLWTHRSYKAHWLLRLFLMILQSMSVNGTIFSWVRDHRTHHKFSDTKYDPKNPSRGFFYSHIGWWLLKKDKEVIEAGNKLNYDDLYEDGFVMFQKKYFYPLVIFFWLILPASVPLLWNENPINSILNCVFFRTVISYHHYFTVNSFAHMYGTRVYDISLRPAESRWVNYIALGEGFHNYHHTFPWDYKSCEKGTLYVFNPGALFIEISSALGLATDLKKASPELIGQRVKRTGQPETHKRKYLKNGKSVLNGLVDWKLGSLVAGWPLILGISLRCIYVYSLKGEILYEDIIEY